MISFLTLGAAALGAAIFVVSYFVIISLMLFYGNRMINSYKMAQTSMSDVGETVGIYQRWVLAAVADAITSMIISGINASYQVYSIGLNYGWVLLGVAFLMPLAVAWTEYHPEAIGLIANVYQCGIARIFYQFPVMRLLNTARLLYDTLWPFMRFLARFTRLLLRSLPMYLFGCTGWKFFYIFLYVANFVVDFARAIATWVSGPGSILNQTLNTTSAWQQLLQIQVPLMTFLECGCSELDFVWIITTEWVRHPSTASVLGAVVAFFAEGLSTGFRSLLGVNLGTFPGVTASWGFLPNPNKMLDMTNLAVYGVRDILNYEIYVLVREFVGIFDDSIFVPGSQGTQVLITSNWLGAVAEFAVAAVEVLRKWIHIGGLGVSIVVQGVIFLFSLIFTAGYLAPFGPPIFCDLREWRAIFDYGGPASLYNKLGGPFGATYRALNEICLLLDTASPYICDLVSPLLKAIIDVCNTFGIGFVTILLMVILPVSMPVIVPIYLFLIPVVIPFVLLRLVFHLIDSEWRMFNPATPPRTGEPLTSWTEPPLFVPPPSLPPPPLAVCVGSGNAYPGFFWPWIQHYIDDPDGIHLLLVGDAQRLAYGVGNLTTLIAPGLGTWFRNLLLAPTYAYDMAIQTVFFLNVLLFSDLYQKAIFAQRWRYGRFVEGVYGIASGFRDFLSTFDALECSDGATAVRRFFCAAGDAGAQYFGIFRGLAFQLFLILITAFVPPLNIPNFTETIAALRATINDLIMLQLILIIPPYPFTSGVTLTDLFQQLFSNAAPVIVLPLDLLNFLFYKIAVFLGPSSSCTTISACTTNFNILVRDIFTYTMQQLADRFGYGVLVGIGVFLDQLIGTTGCVVTPPTAPNDGCIFTRFMLAIVNALVTISNLVTAFAMRLFQYIVAFIGGTIGLFFSSDNSSFDSRLSTFLLALKDLIFFTLFRAPLLLLQLVFGIIGVILPPPLGMIIVTIGKFIVQGLCYVIQFFLTVVIGIINFFGGKLPEINLCCDGSADCTPSIKRGVANKRYTDMVSEEARHVISKVLTKASMSRSQFQDRFQRIEMAVNKHTNKKRALLQTTTDPVNTTTLYMDYLDPSAHTVDFGNYFDPVITSNGTGNLSGVPPSEPIQLTLDEAMAMLADMVAWDGASSCDVFVKGLTREGSQYFKAPADYTLIEHVTVRDCVLRRTVGEVISVMPYFQWFPPDGFYNPLSWLKLGGDAVHAYMIYAQYQSDRQMPREVVLSETYISGWRNSNLNVSHYTEAMYPVFMTNWTLLTYFHYNNGNTAIADMITGYWNALISGVRTQANFMDSLFTSVREADPSEIEAWLLGHEAFDRTLPSDLQQAHMFWRAAIGIMNATWTMTTGTLNAIYDSGVISSSVAVTTAMPQTLKRGYNWYTNLDEDKEWTKATMKRDAQLNSEMRYASKRASMGLDQLRTILPRLRNWASGRLTTLKTKLTSANSPRAKRNWNIVKHLASEAADTIWGEKITLSTLPSTAPAGLLPSQIPIWAARVKEAAEYNTYLASTNSYQFRRRVPTFSTGATVQGRNYTLNLTVDASNTSVILPQYFSTGGSETGDIFSFFTGALKVCNSSIVPFCLNCTAADAVIQETMIGLDEIAYYFGTSNQYTNAKILHDNMEAYLNDTSIARICGGSGSQPILFPSGAALWGTTTAFEIFGGQQGAFLGFIAFVRSLFPSIAEISATASSYTESALVFATATAAAVRGENATLAARLMNIGSGMVRPEGITTDNRIYNYAQSHQGLDTTYLFFDVLYILKPFLLIIDAVAHLFTNFSISYRIAFDPITNSTTSVPVFDDTGDTNLIGFLWTRMLANNWAYTCDQRNMSMLQGLFYTGLIYLVLGILLALTVGLFSTMLASALFGLLIPLFPWAFFRLTYNWGLRSLLWLPFPLFPPCFADDIMDAAVCHLIPKCPALWSGMVNGPYTEANCMSCPTTYQMRNCKLQLQIVDGIDWVVLVIQWVYPPGLTFIAGLIGMNTPNTALLGGLINRLGLLARITKFANVDFGDVWSFDAYTSCMGVMSLAALPGLVVSLILLSIFASAVFSTLVGVLLKFAKIPVAVYYLFTALVNSIVLEYVYVVTPADITLLRASLGPDPDTARLGEVEVIVIAGGGADTLPIRSERKRGGTASGRRKKVKKGFIESVRSVIASAWVRTRSYVANLAEDVASSAFWKLITSTRPIKRSSVQRMIDAERLRKESRRIAQAMQSSGNNPTLRRRYTHTTPPPSVFDNF